MSGDVIENVPEEVTTACRENGWVLVQYDARNVAVRGSDGSLYTASTWEEIVEDIAYWAAFVEGEEVGGEGGDADAD